MVQLFIALMVYRIIFPSAYSCVGWTVAVGLHIIHSVVMAPAAILTFYLFVAIFSDVQFADYKQISVGLVESRSPVHITLVALCSAMLIEIILADLGYLLLVQENSMTIWCTRSWKLKILDMVMKLGIMGVFILDAGSNYMLVTSACLGFLFLSKSAAWFWVPLSTELIREFADCFYDVCCSLALLLVLLCRGFNSYFALEDYYRYSLAIPICALLVCFVRVLFLMTPYLHVKFKTESEAMEYLRTLISLCTSPGIWQVLYPS